MGSCLVKREKIIVNIKNLQNDEDFNSSHKNNSKGIETIQTSNCISYPNNLGKIQWNSQIKKRIDLCTIMPNYNELFSKANSISKDIQKNLSLFLEKGKQNNEKSIFLLKHFIISPPNDYMICPVCEDILLNPFHCTKCNLFICEHCFNETYSQVCEHEKDINLNEYYLNIISILSNESFKCFNSTFGCSAEVSYNSFFYDSKEKFISSFHYKECEYHSENIKCPYTPCDYSGSMLQYKNHLYRCKHKKFICYFCDKIFNFKDFQIHKKNEEIQLKKTSFALPVRLCKCGEMLEWCPEFTNNSELNEKICYQENYCSRNSYYKCSKCSLHICENHSPVPVTRLCGCNQKLMGGIIKKCSVCLKEGGTGWYCNSCEKGVELCENCLADNNEVETCKDTNMSN